MVSSNDVARLFLQSVISRRVVSDKLARVLWGKCIEAVKAADDSLEIHYDPNMFDDFTNDLNTRLQPVDLKLSVTIDEGTGKKVWAMVNTKGDELAQLATDYTAVEIAYFKAVVEQIVLASSESYSISALAALREVNGLKPAMSKSQAEILLDSFVAKGWFIKSDRERFSLSSRTLLELQGYLKSNYEDDIHECTFCFELLTKGVRCYIPACNARLHDHCYKRFARENNTCPTCRSPWSDDKKPMTIGEGAVRDGEEGRRRTKKGDEDENENENEDEDEIDSEEEPEPEPKPDKKRSNRKAAKGKKKQKPADEEEDSTGDEMEVDGHQPAKSQNRRRKR